jgi:hypothetical protein
VIVTTDVDVDDTCIRRSFCGFSREVVMELNAAVEEVEQSRVAAI